jgi:signal transduction histidine kinase
VRPTARAKNVTLVAELDASIGRIEGAPDRLQQVVWNLLMNSVKFTPSGGRVEIVSHRRPKAAAIVVTDTGQGIDPEVMPHVFEAFRQEDSSSTRAEGGLGLGLTLVHRLVELHGGTVVAESSGRDQGTTFTVTLPLP